MKKFGIGIFLLALTMSGSVIAGLAGLTHHSRANCGNNESISWDATRSHMLETVSFHMPRTGYDRDNHTVYDRFRDTWRSAAVHWGEAVNTKNWAVHGSHWMKDKKGKMYIAETELVYDCSIYDGWWDK